MIMCQEVLVKFVDRSLAQQSIRALEIPGAHRLQVQRDDRFLVIDYVSIKGHKLKELNFNLTDVKEYACLSIENIIFVERE